jgi:Protein of unknown function (DUF3108)
MKSTAPILAGLVALASPALAAGGEDLNPGGAPASTLELTLQLFAGGIPLGKAGLSARVQGGEYKAASTLETLGIVNSFWQSRIETAATGTLADGSLRPVFYDSFSQNRRDSRRHVTLNFRKEGPVEVVANPLYPETSFKVPEAEQRKGLDPLSAIVMLIAVASAQAKTPCTAEAPVFDGRRRYDVSVEFVRRMVIKMDNGLYSGPGMLCQFHYRQVAGYQQTLVDQGRRLPPIYGWVAPVRSKVEPNREYMLPMRIWAETDFGIIAALATEAVVDSTPLAQARR